MQLFRLRLTWHCNNEDEKGKTGKMKEAFFPHANQTKRRLMGVRE